MPGNEVPASQVPDLARELRALVRAGEQRAGRKIDRGTLAKAVHISPQSLYAYLSGSRLPPAGTLDALLIELGASGDQLRLLAGMRDQVEESRRRAVLPAVAAMPPVRHALPADTAAFTGRSGELGWITAVVAGAAGAGGVVAVGAIGGMPGVGKTTLAVHAAHMLKGRFPDRQLFIDLHGHTPGHDPVTAEDALARLLAATGVDPRYMPGDLAGRAALWRDRMAGQRALLVLDNAASSSQVAPLLPGGGCLVLVTSRRHLGDLPSGATPVLVDVLPPGEAQEMFIRLALRAASDSDGVGEVVALAGYLPLAISLLARVLARHPSWTLADLAAEVRAGVLSLAAESDSVAAAFEVSYRHLDAGLQRLFRLLSVHPGATVDSYAAAALAGTGLEGAAGLLDRLHAEGLLTEVGYRRYGMHDLLRRYARDRVDRAGHGEGERALGRLLDYYQYTASLAGTRLAHVARPGPAPTAPGGFEVLELQDADQALAWARAERANLLACLDLAARTGQHGRVVALTAGLAPLLRRDGPRTKAVTCHVAAVVAARHLGDRLGEANALTNLGTARLLTSDYPGAAGPYKQALGIYRDLGSRLGEANALTNLGIVRNLTGDYSGGAGIYEKALGIYRDIGNQRGEANTLTNLAELRQVMGDYAGATRALEEALGIYRDIGGRQGKANALKNLGKLRQVTGDYAGAIGALDEALGIYRDIGDRQGGAEARNEQGTLHRVRGDLTQAEGCHQQALDLFRAIGNPLEEARAMVGLGRCAIAASRTAQAVILLQQAHEIFHRIGAAETQDALAELDALTRSGSMQ